MTCPKTKGGSPPLILRLEIEVLPWGQEGVHESP